MILRRIFPDNDGPARAVPRYVQFPFTDHSTQEQLANRCIRCGSYMDALERGAASGKSFEICFGCRV